MTAKRQHQHRKDQSNGNSRFVFVYGTLRRGFWNNRLLAKSVFLGSGKTKHLYAMYVGGIPYAVKEEVSQIVGEVFGVDQETLEDLDRLEAHPSWYERQEVEVVLDDGQELVAWMYFSRQAQGELRASGDFLDATDARAVLSLPRILDKQLDSPIISIMPELCVALQRRGFLVLENDNDILLHRDSNDQDEQILRDWGLKVVPVNSPHWRARVSAQPADVKRALEGAHDLAADNGGLEGHLDPPVPVRNLEPGIALFVKALEICGIPTEMSCEGHPGEDNKAQVPTIWFRSNAIKLKAKAFLDEKRHAQEFEPLMFKYSTATGDGFKEQWVEISHAEAELSQNEQVRRVALVMSDRENASTEPPRDEFFNQIRVASASLLRKAVGI